MKFETDTAVERAMAVFWRNGYSAATPQALLDEIGIGKGSFYNTFQSKHGLFGLVLQRYKEQRLSDLAACLSGDGAGEAESRAMRDRLGRAICDLIGLGTHEQGCLMVNSTGELGQADEMVAEVAEDLFGGMEEIFLDAIERGRLGGEFLSSQDARDSASSLVATVIGASILLQSRNGTTMAERAIRAATGAL